MEIEKWNEIEVQTIWDYNYRKAIKGNKMQQNANKYRGMQI